jgi:8-oxo-dGTP pyrophosphatase MutT (NUDIX family)
MTFERSAGAIIFRRENADIIYLLLNYPSGAERTYWDLAKGHIEKDEEELATVKREVEEETGLKDIKILDGFREQIKYSFMSGKQLVSKVVTFYLAETHNKEVRISPEHIGYIWLPYQEASDRLTFVNAKNVLKKAREFIPRD